MIIENSNIKYIHFGVTELNYKCNPPKEKSPISMELEVDLNYDIFKIDENKNIFQIVIDLKLSPPNNTLGYLISLKPFGVFELPASEDKKQTDSALMFTCIPMILGSIRGFISEITVYFPFGKYLMPSLSLSSIIAANKRKSIESNEI